MRQRLAAAKPADAKNWPTPEIGNGSSAKADEKKPGRGRRRKLWHCCQAGRPSNRGSKTVGRTSSAIRQAQDSGARADRRLHQAPTFPNRNVQARINLLNVLREFKALGGEMVELDINDMQRADPLWPRSPRTASIFFPKKNSTTAAATYKKDNIFMGVAFTCGLEKMVLPFIDRGLPAEYELVRLRSAR